MSDSLTEPPYFQGIAVSSWSSSRRFRVYALPAELVFIFTHSEKGRMTLCIESVDDMKVAIENVSLLLGSQVAVNVEWSQKKKEFVAKG